MGGQAQDWDGARYDQLSDPQARWGLTVLSRLELAGAETVLDAGCGSGRVTEDLLALAAPAMPEPVIDYVRLNIVGDDCCRPASVDAGRIGRSWIGRG